MIDSGARVLMIWKNATTLACKCTVASRPMHTKQNTSNFCATETSPSRAAGSARTHQVMWPIQIATIPIPIPIPITFPFPNPFMHTNVTPNISRYEALKIKGHNCAGYEKRECYPFKTLLSVIPAVDECGKA
jgi:hypothetical protein